MSLSGTYENYVANFIIFGILLAMVLKLLKLDKLASTTFNSAILFPALAVIPFLIFVLIYGLLSLIVQSQMLKAYIAIAITACGILMYLVTMNVDSDNYLQEITLKEKIKIRYELLKDQAIFYSKKYFFPQSESKEKSEHIEILAFYDYKIKSESENKIWYLALATIFYICVYQLLMDQDYFEYFLYQLGTFQKYTLVIGFLFLFLFLYNLYYSKDSKLFFSKIIDLVNFLEKEKQYVLIVDDPERKGLYSYLLVKYHPWKNKENTNYYFFTHTKEMDLAYWINSRLDFRHFRNVTNQISKHGVEGFIDLVISKTHGSDK